MRAHPIRTSFLAAISLLAAGCSKPEPAVAPTGPEQAMILAVSARHPECADLILDERQGDGSIITIASTLPELIGRVSYEDARIAIGCGAPYSTGRTSYYTKISIPILPQGEAWDAACSVSLDNRQRTDQEMRSLAKTIAKEVETELERLRRS